MPHGKPLRILLAAAIVVAAQAAVRFVDARYAPGAPLPPQRRLSQIPLDLGVWRGGDSPMPATFARATGALEMVNRTYTAPAGESVLLNCGVWTDYSTVLPHSPETCYPAAGWDVLEKRNVAIPRSGGAAQARLLILRRDAEELIVLYWCHLGDDVVLDHGPVRALRQRLRGTGARLPAAVKVTLQAPLSTWDQAEQSLLALAADVMAETANIR